MVTLDITPDIFKKQFVIFNRDENNNLAQEPLLDTLTNRNCFLYDKVTRTLFQHFDNNKNVQLVGNTYFGTIGKHNETHNDSVNNKVEGGGSFGTVIGSNNILNYDNDGGFVTGHYNKPNNTYLFSIGNGTDNNNRSNLVQATNDTFAINGNLVINGKKLETIINNSNTQDGAEIQLLKDRVRELESKLNTLINELGQQTLLVEDKTN